MELVQAAPALMKSMNLWRLRLGPLQLPEESASWFARRAPTWVGMWLLVSG